MYGGIERGEAVRNHKQNHVPSGCYIRYSKPGMVAKQGKAKQAGSQESPLNVMLPAFSPFLSAQNFGNEGYFHVVPWSGWGDEEERTSYNTTLQGKIRPGMEVP